ncbi:MAG TPA: hypothetical protein DCZ97_17610 [Syntrophus sp. (in: bacteria)]|nr:hypothetical protein [Syntrophus sp. (in: bacteria)]
MKGEEKIRIILKGLRGEYSIANICRKEGTTPGSTCCMASSVRCASLVRPRIRGAAARAPD